MSRLNTGRTVAITRPEEDGRKIAAELEARGFSTLLVPMLRIEKIEGIAAVLERALSPKLQAMCVTSKHAVRVLAGTQAPRDITLFAVGGATAQEATQAGFTEVTEAGGNVESLFTIMVNFCRPENGTLLYLRGEVVTCELAEKLRQSGFAADEMVVYKAVAVEAFPGVYAQALRQGKVDEVLFYSRASAENYVRLAIALNLATYHRKITASAISETAAEPLSALPWQQCNPWVD